MRVSDMCPQNNSWSEFFPNYCGSIPMYRDVYVKKKKNTIALLMGMGDTCETKKPVKRGHHLQTGDFSKLCEKELISPIDTANRYVCE